VIVFSSDRLTRNPVDGDILRRELRQYGVELHYTTRGAIDDTPEAELFSGIEDQFNAYWRNKLLEATKRGRREKAEAGIVLGQGRDMYGYQVEALRITATLGITEDVKWLDIHWNLHTIRVPLDTSTSPLSAWV